MKVLLFLDVGGSMDDHVRVCEELFSAARTEFKHLEYFYFHNFIYETVWKDNRRRHTKRIPLLRRAAHLWPRLQADLRRRCDHEPVRDRLSRRLGRAPQRRSRARSGCKRLLDVYHHAVWLNPQPEDRWSYYDSIGMVRELMGERMYPLTLGGLEEGMRELSR